MTDVIVVLTTTASPDEASRLARTLVADHLAACVQILPGMRSVFFWEGRVEEATESLILIKTTREAYALVEGSIREMHRQSGGYETPEIIALPVGQGSSSYLAWLKQAVSQTGRPEAGREEEEED